MIVKERLSLSYINNSPSLIKGFALEGSSPKGRGIKGDG